MKVFLKKYLGVIAAVAVFALVCAALHAFVFHTVHIQGTSMVDTLRSGDIALVTRMGTPERGDIVECSFPGRSGTYVKRLIGLPGEKIEIIDSRVYVNGNALSEPYASGPSEDYSLVLQEGEYLVLGDNRSESYDSRAEDMGPVCRENLLGQVRLVLWPFKKIS